MPRSIRRLTFVSSLCWSVWTQGTAAAQTENYETVLVGESAAGMGGAFTALSDDGSATMHNPAGLGQIMRSRLSLSANTYTYHSTTFEDLVGGYGRTADLDVGGVMVLPNTAAYVLPVYGSADVQHTVALSVIVPYAFDWEGHQRLSIPEAAFDFDIFRSVDQRAYLAGPSYGMRIGNLYLGASLFGQYLYSVDQERLVLSLSGDGGSIRSQSFQFSSLHHISFTAIVGALYRFTEQLSVGLRVRLPNIHVSGSAHVYRDVGASAVTIDEAGMPQEVALYQDVYPDVKADTRIRYPMSFSLGVAYREPRVFRVAADVRLYLPQDSYVILRAPVQPPPMQPVEFPGFEGERGFDPTVRSPEAKLVVNYAIGGELYLGDEFYLLGGLFTDLSSVPEGDSEADGIDIFGASLALSRKDEESSLTVGIIGRYGTGTSTGLRVEESGGSEVEIDITQWSITALIGASSTLGS